MNKNEILELVTLWRKKKDARLVQDKIESVRNGLLLLSGSVASVEQKQLILENIQSQFSHVLSDASVTSLVRSEHENGLSGVSDKFLAEMNSKLASVVELQKLTNKNIDSKLAKYLTRSEAQKAFDTLDEVLKKGGGDVEIKEGENIRVSKKLTDGKVIYTISSVRPVISIAAGSGDSTTSGVTSVDGQTGDVVLSGVYEPKKSDNDNYVTDAEKTVLGNTSGVNTGDQESSDFQHGELLGLQGGTTDEYYHLTAAQSAQIAALQATILIRGLGA